MSRTLNMITYVTEVREKSDLMINSYNTAKDMF